MFNKDRFRIEPFRHRVDLEPDYKEKTWKILENAMHEIFNKNPSRLSFEELYRSGYNLVNNKFGQFLYDNLVMTLSVHLDAVGLSIESHRNEDFLQGLASAWSDYTSAMQIIHDILIYMNKTFVSQHGKTPTHELSLQLWDQRILQRPFIKSALQRGVLDAIQRYRAGEREMLVREVPLATTMAMDIGRGVYEALIEKPVEEDTSAFYRREAQNAIVDADCPSFLRLVERRLREEVAMIDVYLFDTSKQKILRRVEKEMLENQVDALVHMEDSGLLHQLKAGDYANLELMHTLFRRVKNGHPAMVSVLNANLLQVGEAILKERGSGPMHQPSSAAGPPSSSSAQAQTPALSQSLSGRSVEVVKQLMHERTMMDDLIRKSFKGDKNFANAIQSCFEKIVNSNASMPEYVSLYMDNALRRSMKDRNQEEVEGLIDRVMTLFRYLEDKDVFEKYYKQHLAKRLLVGKLSLEEQERSVILKLKTECGYQFTSKLESMFNDIRTSQDMMQSFNAQVLASEKSTGGIDLGVQVLTTGAWPTPSQDILSTPGPAAATSATVAGQCRIPTALQHCCTLFEDFYLKTHSGRKLTWQTAMGNGEIRAVFRGTKDGAVRKHDLCVSTLQMCVLLMFNDQDAYKYEEIAEATGIAEAELKRTLQSLACVKGKNVLTKDPLGRDVGNGDVFTYNEDFRSKLYRVKIGTISANRDGRGDGNEKQVKMKIEEDRKPQIEAAIVRIMKSRRILNHNEIVSEVTQMLSSRFLPSPAMIKQRMESLIEREFLERDETDRRKYKYIA